MRGTTRVLMLVVLVLDLACKASENSTLKDGDGDGAPAAEGGTATAAAGDTDTAQASCTAEGCDGGCTATDEGSGLNLADDDARSNGAKFEESSQGLYGVRVKGKAGFGAGMEYDLQAQTGTEEKWTWRFVVPGSATDNPAPCPALRARFSGNTPAGMQYRIEYSKGYILQGSASVVVGADFLVAGSFVGGTYQSKRQKTFSRDERAAAGGKDWATVRQDMDALLTRLRGLADKDADDYYKSIVWDIEVGRCSCAYQCWADDGRRGGKWERAQQVPAFDKPVNSSCRAEYDRRYPRSACSMTAIRIECQG